MKKQQIYKGDSARLPPITSALALLVVGWEVQRDVCGQKTCEAVGVGAYRRKLGMLTIKPPRGSISEMARDEARTVLARMCATCQLECPMKEWGITPPSG
jgi:hypothetical protein